MPPSPDNDEHNQHDHDDSEIQRQNLIALAFVTVLTVFGIWLVDGFRKHVQLEECIEAGHRNCVPLDIEKSSQ